MAEKIVPKMLAHKQGISVDQWKTNVMASRATAGDAPRRTTKQPAATMLGSASGKLGN